MKKVLLFLLLLSSAFVNAQSLKEALYGGKLKNEPGTVIRKGDDLSTKIDTVRKIAANDSLLNKITAFTTDSLKKALTQTDSTLVADIVIKDTVSGTTDIAVTEAVTTPKETASVTKDNNTAWKVYMDSVSSTLKTEVLSSKKIKRGTYYVTVSYAIGTDGQVAINNVLVTPENAFLQQQIKDRVTIDSPRLTPVLSSSGAPRKVSKNYNFTLSKD